MITILLKKWIGDSTEKFDYLCLNGKFEFFVRLGTAVTKLKGKKNLHENRG